MYQDQLLNYAAAASERFQLPVSLFIVESRQQTFSSHSRQGIGFISEIGISTSRPTSWFSNKPCSHNAACPQGPLRTWNFNPDSSLEFPIIIQSSVRWGYSMSRRMHMRHNNAFDGDTNNRAKFSSTLYNLHINLLLSLQHSRWNLFLWILSHIGAS